MSGCELCCDVTMDKNSSAHGSPRIGHILLWTYYICVVNQLSILPAVTKASWYLPVCNTHTHTNTFIGHYIQCNPYFLKHSIDIHLPDEFSFPSFSKKGKTHQLYFKLDTIHLHRINPFLQSLPHFIIQALNCNIMHDDPFDVLSCDIPLEKYKQW